MCFDEIVCPKGQEFLVKERIDVRNAAGRIVRGFREEPVWKSIKNIAKGDYLCVAINNKSELPKWNGSYYNQFGHHRLLNTLSPLFEQPDFWYVMWETDGHAGLIIKEIHIEVVLLYAVQRRK